MGSWSIVKKVGPPTAFEDSIDWLESGGWEALPDHEIASAVDGGSLKFVGVSDQTIEGSRDRLDIAMPSNADSLAVAEEIDSDGILREAVRHIGDLSRKPLHKLTIGEELETQGKMIDELEQDVDGTNSRLAAAQRKMNQVLKKAGMKGQMCIIVILTAILIILFLIAFM